MTLDGIADLKGGAPSVPSARGSAPARESEIATGERDSAASHATSSARELSTQMEKLTRALQATQNSLSFSVDENTGKTIVRVVSSTGELVRQIPSEEALAIAATLAPGDSLKSLGLDWWS
jgi:flagellar protein FlaG